MSVNWQILLNLHISSLSSFPAILSTTSEPNPLLLRAPSPPKTSQAQSDRSTLLSSLSLRLWNIKLSVKVVPSLK